MTKRNKPRSKPERNERPRSSGGQPGRDKPQSRSKPDRGAPPRRDDRGAPPRRDDRGAPPRRDDRAAYPRSRNERGVPPRPRDDRNDPALEGRSAAPRDDRSAYPRSRDQRGIPPRPREGSPAPNDRPQTYLRHPRARDAEDGTHRNGASSRSVQQFELPRLSEVPAPRAVLLTPPPENEFADADDDYASEEAPELGIGTRVVAPNVRFEAETSPPSSESGARLRSSTDPAELEAQIRSLEARLDGLIRRAALASEPAPPPSIGDPPAGAGQAVELAETAVVRPPGPAVVATEAPAGYVQRQWGREALRSRQEEVDDFGLDPSFESKLMPGIDLLYRRYFRVQVEGIHHVPSTGRAVIVANHGGTLPLDGAMLRTAIRLDHPSRRDLRWLAEDFVFHLPFAGVFLNRIGAVRACPENAERLLEKDSLVAVFPEGVHGIKKLFRQRYQLQRFGRGGYIRLCLRMRAPLIPCAIIGAEEANPLLYRLDTLAELWKLPYLPITPTFPLLGPLGLVPAPTRWKLRFGEPISFDHYGPEALDDHVLVGRLSERVRAAIQGLLDSGLSQRKSVWFG